MLPHPLMEDWKEAATWNVLALPALCTPHHPVPVHSLCKSLWGLVKPMQLQRRLTLAWNQRVLQACNFPILTAEGLIKYFRNISVLFYLPEGKGHVNQPWVIHPNHLCHVKRSQMVLFHFLCPHYPQGCLRIAIPSPLLSLSGKGLVSGREQWTKSWS